jgi:hypothetical protein
MMEDAARSVDAYDAADLEFQGERLRAMWRCPVGGMEPPASAEDLPFECQGVLRAVHTVTEADGFTTCPMASGRLLWVHRAARARGWRDHGELGAREADPPATLLEAIDIIDDAYGARLEQENKQRQREAEKNQADIQRKASGG